MRPDMHKVLVERPRRYGGPIEKWSRRRERGRRNNPEHAPRYEPMRPRMVGRKEFSDHQNPIEGWLRKNVGRPWDDVFSEACAIASLDGTVRRHLRTHVDGLVEQDVVMRDGEPGTYGWGGWRSLRPYSAYTRFYVCPRTGLLRSITGTSWRSRHRRT